MTETLRVGRGSRLYPLPQSSWVEEVQRLLATLQRGLGAQCVLLIDGEGRLLTRTGTAGSLSLEEVLPIIAEESALTARLNRSIEGGVGVSLHHYEGARYQVYTAVAADNPFLLVVLSPQSPPRRLGVTWLFLRRTLEELRGLLQAGGVVGAGPAWAETVAFGSLTPEQAQALGLVSEESLVDRGSPGVPEEER